MTNSMIPYSFIPGMKAKAGEVNANFIALADAIEENKNSSDTSISEILEDIDEIKDGKADKTAIFKNETISAATTDLNTVFDKGNYVFANGHAAVNSPKNSYGTLLVWGDKNTVLYQLWHMEDDCPEFFTRIYKNSAWGTWRSERPYFYRSNPGILKFPTGLIVQWGASAGNVVTYPIAFEYYSSVVVTKHGFDAKYERSDSGFTQQYTTGFVYETGGNIVNINWIAIGA